MISRAMILAAGEGTRLQPLTNHLPKALLLFRGKTMLEHVLIHLKKHGIREVIINIHHHADKIVEFVHQNSRFGIDIEFSDERAMLMDTGGGILKAEWYFKDHGPFLVHNIDIFSDINLEELYLAHSKRRPLATLAVTSRETSRNLLVDSDNYLCGWKNNSTGETIVVKEKPPLHGVAFSGIHIIEPELSQLLTSKEPFSITDGYLKLAANHQIFAYDHSDGVWIDMAHKDNFPELRRG